MRLQWGPKAHVAFASLLHPVIDGLCVCIMNALLEEVSTCLSYLLCLYVGNANMCYPGYTHVLYDSDYFKAAYIFKDDLRWLASIIVQ